MDHWQVQDAKAKFSEMLRDSQTAPQIITHRGEEMAVVISKQEYERLTGAKPSLVTFMQQSPLLGVELHIERDTSFARDISL